MRAVALLLVLALLLVPTLGCLEGGQEVRIDPDERDGPCVAQMTWTQAGIFATIAEQSEPAMAREGLAIDPTAAGLPEGSQLHGVQWRAEAEASFEPATFTLSAPRWSDDERTVMIEARLLSDHEDQAKRLAEAFVANLTDALPEGVEQIADTLLDRDVASFLSADPDGSQTPVTLYRVDHEMQLAAEDLLQGFDALEERATDGELDDVSLSAREWRLWGEVPVVSTRAPVTEPYAQVSANPLDDVAVEIPIEDTEDLPGEDIVNATFAHLDLDDPEPDSWGYEDTCGGVEVQRPTSPEAEGR